MMEPRSLRLKINYANGDLYWAEHFNSVDALDTWLNEEKTRPYWDQSWTCHKFDVDGQGNETETED